MKPAIPVVEWIRVSSETQALGDRQGIPAQRSTNVRTCEIFGLRVIETVEVAETGTTVATSPEMGRVLDLVTSGRAHGVVLAAYDRLFRPDRWSDLAILQVFMDAGAQIYVPAGPIDLSTEGGYVSATVGNLMAGLERRRIRERTTRAKDELRRKGMLASGRPPYGLSWDRKTKAWSYTSKIEDVKELFATFLSGRERTYKVLAQRFGISVMMVQKILRHPVYSGWFEWKRATEVIRAPIGLEPAVSPEDFAAVQRILGTRTARMSLTRTHTRETFLYRGMCYCPCGSPLYGSLKTAQDRRYHHYACRSLKERGWDCDVAVHMRRERLEPALDRIISEQLTDATFIVQAVGAFNDSLTAAWREAPAPEVNRIRRDELERRRARILETFYEGVISAAERNKLLEPLETQLAALAIRALPVPSPDVIAADGVLGILALFAEWEYLEWVDKRKILEALAPAFEVQDYRIEGVYLDVGLSESSSRIRHSWAKGSNRPAGFDFRHGLYVPLGVAA